MAKRLDLWTSIEKAQNKNVLMHRNPSTNQPTMIQLVIFSIIFLNNAARDIPCTFLPRNYIKS